jgi:hypothetical protein
MEVDDEQPRPAAPEGSVSRGRRRPGIGTYALLIGLIALVCIVAVELVGSPASSKHFCAAFSSVDGTGCDPGCAALQGC